MARHQFRRHGQDLDHLPGPTSMSRSSLESTLTSDRFQLKLILEGTKFLVAQPAYPSSFPVEPQHHHVVIVQPPGPVPIQRIRFGQNPVQLKCSNCNNQVQIKNNIQTTTFNVSF